MDYSKFLEESGYTDSDWWCEDTNPIDKFISERDDSKIDKF